MSNDPFDVFLSPRFLFGTVCVMGAALGRSGGFGFAWLLLFIGVYFAASAIIEALR